MNYSLVIAAYKSLDNLVNRIKESEDSSLPPTEIIVIVNPSDTGVTDDIIKEVKQNTQVTKWSIMSHNVGVATAWNLGMAMASNNLIVVLNDDCSVGENTYKNIVSSFISDDIGIVGVESGGYPGDAEMTAKGFLFCIRKDLVSRLGGFSELASPLADEVELGLRFWSKGYKTVIANSCQYNHKHTISSNPNTRINYLGDTWIPALEQGKYFLIRDILCKEYNKKILETKKN